MHTQDETQSQSGFEIVDTRLDTRFDLDDTIYIKLANGAEIAVPNDLVHVTSYVLAEQENWFEPELDFWCQVLEPGDTVFDVGANHGVYTLSLARNVGNDGFVVAFEPGKDAAHRLELSVAKSKASSISLVRKALGAQAGKAALFGGSSGRVAVTENCSLVSSKGEPIAEVDVSTLDHEWKSSGAEQVTFLKLDVEEHELEVLTGGQEMIAETSPMIMFEVSGDISAARRIGGWLQERGYRLYRYAWDLGFLVPFTAGELSAYQINLVALMPAQEQRLRERGLIVTHDAAANSSNSVGDIDIPEEGWPEILTSMPVWQRFGVPNDSMQSPIERIRRGRERDAYRDALWSAAIAIDDRQPPEKRWQATRHACAILADQMERSTDFRKSLPKLWTLARVAMSFGSRELALEALGHAARILNRPPASFDQPFLPAIARFDRIDPQEDLVEWTALMTIEPLVTLNNHSSRFTRGEALPALERWQCSRFLSADLERRRQLLRIRVGLQRGLFASPAMGKRPLNKHLLQSEDIEPGETEGDFSLAG